MPRFVTLITGSLFALFLAACAAVGPDYQPPAAEMPAGWHADQAPAATVPAETARWWGLFQDPVLNELVARAIALSGRAQLP